MLTSDYLELIRLTQGYLLNQLPPKRIIIQKNSAPKLNTPPLPTQIIPQVEQKVKSVPSIPPVIVPEIKVQEPHKDLEEILTLLKKTCKQLKILDGPPKQNDILLLFDQEPVHEKQLLINLAAALKKEGCSSAVLEVISLKDGDLQKADLLICERALFEKYKLVHPKMCLIPSLAGLIEQPATRRGLWSEILNLLKIPLTQKG